MTYSNVVAIDGPCGSGKSTIAKLFAERVGALYVDTGAMFRALGYVFKTAGMDFSDEAKIADHLSHHIKLEYAVTPEILIRINGEDLTQKVREHSVSALASEVSRISCVRKFLLNFQRELAKAHCCVMEGRDIGTVVFPDAFCKVYLTATPEVRAKRRLDQLILKGETHHSFTEILNDVNDRDAKDMNRSEAPLKQASDAILLDTSSLTVDQVIESLDRISKNRASECGQKLK